MKQVKQTRANKPQPTIVWRCPSCGFEALSNYNAKRHRAFASCEEETQR